MLLEVTKKYSGGCFTYNHTPGDGVIFVDTRNVFWVKGKPILVLGHNLGAWLEGCQIGYLREKETMATCVTVRLVKKHFKPCSFRDNFFNLGVDGPITWDELAQTAAEQNETKYLLLRNPNFFN